MRKSALNITLLFISIINCVNILFAQDTLYMYQNGYIVGKRAVSDIDSMIFYKVTPATVTDIDGNVYNTITIGTQKWLKENLKVTRYRNGDLIGTTNPVTLDISGETNPEYQWAYNGSDSLAGIYGRLYTWHTISDARGICPSGWHVASDAEWSTLASFLGDESVVGGKLKETGLSHWKAPNGGATNEFGFTALPCGERYNYGEFLYLGEMSYWWTSTGDANPKYASMRYIFYSNSYINKTLFNRDMGFAVRCTED